MAINETDRKEINLTKDKRRQGPTPLDKLIEYFHSNESTSKFAYRQALDALEAVQKTATNKDHFLECIVSDIIFTALYSTILEEMYVAVRVHQDVAIPLIQKFSESSKERDKLINIHTKNHLLFIENNGECNGCSSCEGHADVASLLPCWHKKDLDYFIKLYLEVQTIYVALERILYEYLPLHMDFIPNISLNLITQFRTYVAHYVARRLSNA